MTVVVDASVAASWVLLDEAEAGSDAILDRGNEGGGHVPGLWALEVINTLFKAERPRTLAAGRAACRHS